jgi:4-amino-4-deoxy-L-arabinose transferase-like glycosyltransferase
MLANLDAPILERNAPRRLSVPVAPAVRTAGAFALLLAVSYPLLFHRLADRDLSSSHEARAAQDAQTILDDGAWGLPHLFDGRPEMQKPPLYYWLVASFASFAGGHVDAWSVRLPAALAGLGAALLLFTFGVIRGRSLFGFLAAMVLLSSMHFTWLARVGRIDMPLAFMTTAALLGFYLATQNSELRTPWLGLLLFSYVSIAAAVMLKGPIGIVLPAVVLFVHLLVEREVPAPWRLRAWAAVADRFGLWWGIPLVVALTLPWFLWANAATNGEFFRVFFWRHNFERGFGGADDGHAGLRAHPWWFYAPRLTFDMLPWSLLLPVAVWFLWRRRLWRDAEARFGAVWLVTVVGLLSLMRFKRADYLLPAFPGAALLIGGLTERCISQSAVPRRWAFGLTAVLLAYSGGWLWYVERVLPGEEAGRDQRPFATAVRQAVPAPQPILLFRTEPHALAFHLGRPLALQVEWSDLAHWSMGPGPHYVVMPPEWVAEATQLLPGLVLEPVLDGRELGGAWHEKPLVLYRTAVLTPSSD